MTERKNSDDRNRLFTREIRHRAKNLLAVVLAIHAGQRKKRPGHICGGVFHRIARLSSTLDLLGRGDWLGVDFHQLFETQIERLPKQGTR